jgi:hypothetical protein
LSNKDAKKLFRLEALVLDDQGRFPGRFIFTLTPFGIGSHGIVHVVGCLPEPGRKFWGTYAKGSRQSQVSALRRR